MDTCAPRQEVETETIGGGVRNQTVRNESIGTRRIPRQSVQTDVQGQRRIPDQTVRKEFIGKRRIRNRTVTNESIGGRVRNQTVSKEEQARTKCNN